MRYRSALPKAHAVHPMRLKPHRWHESANRNQLYSVLPAMPPTEFHGQQLLGGLAKAHHRIVSRSEQITGNFNRHLEDTLFLQGDEAYWAGAKASEGALKDLITNDRIQIERKGVDPYTANNYTRVLFTSNEDFVVPASLDERRYAAFDVGIKHMQDSEYFEALSAWYESGGAGHLLQYLREYDLSDIDLRKVPATDALSEQKLQNLDTVQLPCNTNLKHEERLAKREEN